MKVNGLMSKIRFILPSAVLQKLITQHARTCNDT